MLAQAIECAATEHAVGIVGRAGGVIDLLAAVALKQASEVWCYAAGKEDTAVVHFFPWVVAGYNGRFDDGHAIVTADSKCTYPNVKVCVRPDEWWSDLSWLKW